MGSDGTRRWLFADQLGRHFLDDAHQPVLLIESRRVFARRRFHRQKAHLVLSALRHRAAELADQAVFLQTGTYGEALDTVDEPLTVCSPTSRSALQFVERREGVTVLPERGFATGRAEFETWASGQKSMLMENFYRDARRRHDVLMDGDEPAGNRWNLDADNREPPPKKATTLGVPDPWRPTEDEIDEEVRHDLDTWERDGDVSFVGRDGPRRFAATRREARTALRDFVEHRLAGFGPHEDAMLAGDPTMSHSLLSAPMNLGLLDPLECVELAESAYRAGDAPLSSVEGYIRQLIGWRDYIWGVYWHVDDDYRRRNALGARKKLPDWLWQLDADAVQAWCLSDVLAGVRDTGWAHHIPRLMVLGSWALQRGIDPDELTTWFHQSFVDGYDWVMAPNVVGMSQHADGGLMATKPYTSGGAYINKMSDYCAPCVYTPTVRVGEKACPFTAGYWAFLDRVAPSLAGNRRMMQPLHGLDRLTDRDELVAAEKKRGTAAP